MPGSSFSCPHCGKTLKSPQPIPAGKKIKCPTCGEVFVRPADENEPTGVKGRRDADEDDVQDKPRAKKRAIVDDDDEDDAPSGKKAKKGGGAGVLIGVVLLLLLLIGGAVGAYFLWFAGGGNKGGGDEDPLAFVPNGADVLIGGDLAATLDDKDVGPLINQVLMQGFTGAQRDRVVKLIEKLAKETGLTRNELASKLVLATNSDVFAAPPMAAAGGPGGMAPGGRGGMAPGGRGPGPGGMAPGMSPMGAKVGTLILHASKPFDQKKIAKSFAEPKSKKSDGKEYYEIADTDFATLYMPSNQTLILSSSPASELESLFKSDGKTPSISADGVALVRSVDKSSVWAVALFDGKLRATMEEDMRKDPPPPELKEITELIVKGKGLAGWATLTSDQLTLGVTVACADEASATKLVQASEKAWKAKSLELIGLTAVLAIKSPKIGKLVNEATGSLKFTADGSMGKATTGASRGTAMDAVNEFKATLGNAMGGGGGPPQKPNPQGGKPIPQGNK